MGFMRGQGDRELTAFAGTLRAALVPAEAPGAARLVPMLAEAARSAGAEASVRPRRRLALAARVAFAVALLPLFSAGLAVAGVSLPGPAQSAFERVGIELPNQAGSGNQTDDDTDETGDAKAGDAKGKPAEPGAKGRENAAEKRAHGQEKSNPAREEGRGVGAQGKGRGLGKRGVAPGQSNPNRGGNGGNGGGGNGKAVGKTDAPPPGQAIKPVTPGKPDSAPGGAGNGPPE